MSGAMENERQGEMKSDVSGQVLLRIEAAVALKLGVAVKSLHGKSQAPAAVLSRQVVAFLACEMTRLLHADIGAFLGQHYWCVRQGARRVRQLIDEGDLYVAEAVESLRETLLAEGVVSESLKPRPAATPNDGPLSRIERAVAQEFGLDAQGLRRKSNEARFARPRQIAAYLSRELTMATLPQIARFFGQHHTTVLYGVERVRRNLDLDAELVRRIASIREALAADGVVCLGPRPAAVPRAPRAQRTAVPRKAAVPSVTRKSCTPRMFFGGPNAGEAAQPSDVDVAAAEAAAIQAAARQAARMEAEDIHLLPRTQRRAEWVAAFLFDATERPSAGTACVWCAEHRHFCPARGYSAELPLCRECAALTPCEHAQAVDRMRNGLGEMEVDEAGLAGLAGPCRTIRLTAADRRPIVPVAEVTVYTAIKAAILEGARAPRACRVLERVVDKAPASAQRRRRGPGRGPGTAKRCVCGKRLHKARASTATLCRACKPRVMKACGGCGTMRHGSLKGEFCRRCVSRQKQQLCSNGCGRPLSQESRRMICRNCQSLTSIRNSRPACSNADCAHRVSKGAERPDGRCGMCVYDEARLARRRAKIAAQPQGDGKPWDANLPGWRRFCETGCGRSLGLRNETGKCWQCGHAGALGTERQAEVRA